MQVKEASHSARKQNKPVRELEKTSGVAKLVIWHILNKMKIPRRAQHKCLQILHFSLMMPYMSYCVEVWGSVYKTNIDPMIKIQEKAIRILNLLVTMSLHYSLGHVC